MFSKRTFLKMGEDEANTMKRGIPSELLIHGERNIYLWD